MGKIGFEYDGKNYTLEYTANSIAVMEKNGFDFSKMGERLLSIPEELFKGALIEHHPHVGEEKAHEMFYALSRTPNGEESETDELVVGLSEMLQDAVKEITNRRGNVPWRRIG